MQAFILIPWLTVLTLLCVGLFYVRFQLIYWSGTIKGAQDSSDSDYFFFDRHGCAKYWLNSLPTVIKLYYKDCAWAYSMVDFNWWCGMCFHFFLWILSQSWNNVYWVQDTWCFIRIFCNFFLKSKYCLVASQYYFSGSEYHTFRFYDLFLLVAVSHSILFVFSRNGIKRAFFNST